MRIWGVCWIGDPKKLDISGPVRSGLAFEAQYGSLGDVEIGWFGHRLLAEINITNSRLLREPESGLLKLYSYMAIAWQSREPEIPLLIEVSLVSRVENDSGIDPWVVQRGA